MELKEKVIFKRKNNKDCIKTIKLPCTCRFGYIKYIKVKCLRIKFSESQKSLRNVQRIQSDWQKATCMALCPDGEQFSMKTSRLTNWRASTWRSWAPQSVRGSSGGLPWAMPDLGGKPRTKQGIQWRQCMTTWRTQPSSVQVRVGLLNTKIRGMGGLSLVMGQK